MATADNYRHFKLERDEDDLLWCHLDQHDASTNVLSSDVMLELECVVGEIERDPPAGVILLSDKDNGFIAGADVTEFSAIRDREQALEIINRVHALFQRLETLTCPTLALIHGFCLGGGLELALACRYRVALDEPGTRLGLPEVKLGIHPGFGGSARLAGLIGALPAMQLMLAGRTVDARRARKLGMVDRVVPRRQLYRAAVALLKQRPAPRRPGWSRRIAGTNAIRPLVARLLRRELDKRVRPAHYPAPYALVELWRRHGGDRREMLAQEAHSVAGLIVGETARNLVRVYALQESLKAAGKGSADQSRHVHVIGAGVMGGDIAAWCALQGYTVTLQDREPALIGPALQRAGKLFQRRLKLPHERTAAMDRLLPDHRGYGMERADVLIEAIIENAAAKIDVFQAAEARVREDTLLATNTSSIPLDEIGRRLQRPERLVGVHFFNPVAQMQLVEVVYSGRTGTDWVARAAAFCRRMDRLPLVVKSSPGFLVNRILTPYLLETVALVEEGVAAEAIDRAAEDFGMPMGPVELADAVGLDICLSVAENMAAALDMPIPGNLRPLVEAGRLGRKSGRGFYAYHKGRARKGKVSAGQIPADLEDRLILRMVNECAACLREQLVPDADLLDAGMIYGTGFAPFRGGPLHYARQLGPGTVADRLAGLQHRYGDRFTPDPAWSTILAE